MSLRSPSFWRGRILALLGILLLSLNLRIVVAATSPIIDAISVDVPLGSAALGLIGTLPPLCFAILGLLTPWLTRRAGLVPTALIALAAILAGHLLRAAAPEAGTLIAGTAVTLAGMGVGNVLLPPLVKRYFPDRIPLLTAAYAVGMCLSTLLPPLLAAPVAEGFGWRWSMAIWVSVAIAAMVPWLLQAVAGPSSETAPLVLPIAAGRPLTMRRLWRSPVAVALAAAAAMNSFHSYSIFAWYPRLMAETAAVPQEQLGLLLALHAAVGLPVGLLLPLAARRIGNLSVLFWPAALLLAACHLGFLLAPAAAPLLLLLAAGLGLLILPVVFVLISQRTRTEEGTVVLSGFVNGIGYAFAALGPFATGVLHELSDGWTASLLLLSGSTVIVCIAAWVLRRPRSVEESLQR